MLSREQQFEISVRLLRGVLETILPHLKRVMGESDPRVQRVKQALEDSK